MDRSESLYAEPVGVPEAEEQPLVGADDRSSMIIKGKRTKRQRTPSTCGGGGTAAVSSSSTGGGGDYEFSLSSSSGETVLGSTEEEEDMAYCLILLAQGPRRQTDEGGGAKMDGGDHFRSNKKFSEVAAGGGASTKASFYVYECKTCNRTFPSFQALGGHRAGHKKPRAAAAEDTKRSSPELNSDEDEEEGKFHKITTMSPPLSSIPNFPRKLLQGTKPKIHECSICGLEFSSGQALGGHMRRHRAAVAPSSTMNYHVAMSIDSMVTSHHHDSCVVGENASRGVLSLDLNLPAPEDDSKFQFTAASTTQKSLLFSAPALVDCHY